MDEASQAIEPACLLAFNKHPQKIVMFGDDKQLPPTILSNEAQKAGLDFSLFKRLNSRDFPDTEKNMLKINYRMPKALAAYSSMRFYSSKLESAKENPSKDLEWINEVFQLKDKEIPIPIAFFNIESKEVGVGTSIKNEEEAKQIIWTAKELLGRGTKIKE